ncbi:MAG: flagellar hook capping protein [Tepidanaerobacteraceae bacterium]|jgi:flagellar basal-body rod modification protein FlgD|nr:flagellar hook capping protein [Tepidanaerobacteraceae bacterium]
MTSVNSNYYTAASSASSTSGNKGSSSLGRDEFLKLLTTELKYQNPLDPMDSTEYIAQLAQFSSLEQMQNLNTQMASLSAVSVIGKTAEALDDEGNQISGQVVGVSFNSGKINLIIGDSETRVPLENIIEIK